ncbi:MAG: aldo/keto reductase [SAR324 cluster bacterium]|nr:aldo/keto reductase [SAR324 cluster bacterium]
MRQRKLGGSGIMASAIGLGCMSMSGTYGPAEDGESIAVIHHGLDRGLNFLDTADGYGSGHNEELVGKAIHGRRNDVVLASKFGNTPDGVSGRPEYVQQACEASLKRLGVDVIDLYYQHRVDPETPIEETVGAMGRLIEQGKVRALGLSEAAPETIRRAHAVHPISALQSEYSLMYREAAEQSLPVCKELDIAFVAYSPLGRSLLTGVIKEAADLPEGDRRLAHPRFQGENLEHNLTLVARIAEMAEEKGISPGQLALGWLLAQWEGILPIPGTKHKAYLDDNIGGVSVALDAGDLERIEQVMPPGAAAGTRYPEAQMGRVQL